MDIALFVFRRPQLTLRVLEAIQAAKPSRLFVIADGPRSGNDEEARLVDEVRKLVTSTTFLDCEVVTLFSKDNLGLRERFNSGLDFIFNQTDRCIILEDDCVPSLSFFIFCNNLLELHEKNKEVGIIAGHNFQPSSHDYSYFYSYDVPVWGWATWARTWKAYSNSPLRTRITREDILATGWTYSSWAERYFSERLMRIESGKNWDIPFSTFLRSSGYKNAVSTTNLVDNLGQSDSPSNFFLIGWEPPIPAGSLSTAIRHPKTMTVDSAHEARRWRLRFVRLLVFFLRSPLVFLKRLILEFRLILGASRPKEPKGLEF